MIDHLEGRHIAVIAGGGDLPGYLLKSCESRGINCFLIALKGFADESLFENYDGVSVYLGQLGKIFQSLHEREISDVICIGSVKRPSLGDFRMDWTTLRFIYHMITKPMGDDALLKNLKSFVGKHGFQIHPIQSICPEILSPAGCLTSRKPNKAEKDDLVYGFKLAKEIGKLDIGQALVVQDGVVLGVEAIEGTDKLIERTEQLRRSKNINPTLVKVSKPNQDMSLDVPTVGINTLKLIKAKNFAGLAIEARKTLIVHYEDFIDYANQEKLFVLALSEKSEELDVDEDES